MQRPLIIAHRGASSERPENTLAAYRRAIEIGADFVELDVHLTRDKIPICHHDDVFAPDTVIKEHTLRELKAISEGAREIPTLDEVLSLPFGKVGLMVELKGDDADLVRIVTALVRAKPIPRLILGSFSLTLIKKLREDWPLEQLVSIAETQAELRDQLALMPDRVAIDVPLATTEMMAQFKASGIEVWVWTVDSTQRAQELWRLGVTGIITNDPANMLRRF